jgi:hypothetical protein
MTVQYDPVFDDQLFYIFYRRHNYGLTERKLIAPKNTVADVKAMIFRTQFSNLYFDSGYYKRFTI